MYRCRDTCSTWGEYHTNKSCPTSFTSTDRLLASDRTSFLCCGVIALLLLCVAVKALTVVVYLIATLAISACLDSISTAACSDNLVFCGAITRCVHISVLGYTNIAIVLKAHWALPFFMHHHRYSSCSLLSCSDILSTQS